MPAVTPAPMADAAPMADSSVATPKDIPATAQAAGTFKTLLAALTAAELADVLKGAGPFTVFAPTDDAFAKLPAGTVDGLLKPENKAQLQAVLKYHVVAGKVLAADVVKLTSAATLQGDDVKISATGGMVMINDSHVSKTDVMASNGVIHVIDAVLLPPAKLADIPATAQAAGTFKTLLAALTAAELADVLKGAGPFTVFAPTDDAFAKLPAGTVDGLLKPENKAQLQAVLKYHVVAGKVLAADVVKLTSAATLQGDDVKISATGGMVMINDSHVSKTDVMASNGVIHVIDAVLLPPAKLADIPATAQAAGTFKTLLAALTAAELADVLKGAGPFTVFAPTDDAFAKLPAGTVDGLLKPENKAQLQAVLKYHVVAGKVLAADVVKLTSAATLQGDDVKINATGGMVMVNDSNVSKTDVMASNGVIHVIDAVLLPPAKLADIPATAQAAGTFKTLLAALTAAELADVLKGAGPFTVFAPTDDAFAKLPAGTVDGLLKPENKAQLQAVLKYHVVAGKVLAADVVKLTSATTLQGDDVKISATGGMVMINDSHVSKTDVMASNGVIHVIDAVLLPPAKLADIPATAQAAGTFKTLLAALTAAELADVLKGAGPFTVFAPTDDAFAKLPAGTVDGLLKPENKAQLQAVLKYHVVAGKVLAADVVKLTSATTLQGSDVKIKASGGVVTINDSQVTKTDIMASNGVIHVISAVLLPPS